jgi:hypothetical protein
VKVNAENKEEPGTASVTRLSPKDAKSPSIDL